MKKFIYILAAVALASCGNKAATDDAADTKDVGVETVETAAPADFYAPDGTVHTLDNVSLYAPGVSVPNLTVLDFNAVWCGPCRQLTPVVEELAKDYDGRVTFVSVDVDTYGDLFEAYNLGNSIPAVLILSPDGTKSSYVGTDELLPKEKFAAILDAAL